MAHTRWTLPVLAGVALSVVLMPGCFYMESSVKLNVDGSANVAVKVAVNKALAELGQEEGEPAQADPFAEIAKNLPEGWTGKPLEEEGLQGILISGKVPPGGELLPQTKGEKSDFKTKITRRLFSTDYELTGTLKLEPEAVEEGADTAALPRGNVAFAQADEDGDEEGEEQMPDFGGALGALGAKGPYMQFSVKAPGTVLETSGELDENGTAVWRVEMENILESGGAKPLAVLHRTRLLNHQSIGRLADKLADEQDMTDMAALIGDYVTRDLLPNPPKDAPLKAGLDAKAYADVVHTVATIENLVGPKATPIVVRALKLNADNVTAKQLAQTWAMVSEMDEAELTEVVGQAAAKHLRMRLGR